MHNRPTCERVMKGLLTDCRLLFVHDIYSRFERAETCRVGKHLNATSVYTLYRADPFVASADDRPVLPFAMSIRLYAFVPKPICSA